MILAVTNVTVHIGGTALVGLYLVQYVFYGGPIPVYSPIHCKIHTQI